MSRPTPLQRRFYSTSGEASCVLRMVDKVEAPNLLAGRSGAVPRDGTRMGGGWCRRGVSD